MLQRSYIKHEARRKGLPTARADILRVLRCGNVRLANTRLRSRDPNTEAQAEHDKNYEEAKSERALLVAGWPGPR